jgi:alkylation response protein AidB-like acyl-CoA dehydrogenase
MSTGTAPYSFAPFRESLGTDFLAADPFFEQVLRHHGLDDELKWKRLRSYGKFVASSAAAGADMADRPGELPYLTPFDAWGVPHPVGLSVPQATRRVLAASLRAGAATEPDVLLRYGMGYLGAQVGEAGVTCPLACTDGLVRALQELDCGTEATAALAHVLLQSPGAPVHGAQFVTEVQGGSDAATNATVAIPQSDGSYLLRGKKWFCSNAWAQYWVVTARPEGSPAGPRGVGLFFVPRETADGQNNGFRLDRLKDKVGTRSLPTAEMTLTGARGWLLGDEGSGLSNLVRIVLTTSRFWNAMAAAATMRAAQRIGLAYSEFREAFGQPIAAFPLVAESLDNLDRDARNYTAAAFAVLAAWERVATKERAGETPDAAAAVRLRILVMLAKACATRRATQRIHETIMLLGGNGIEERFSALPRLWRDSIIYETWEGPHGLLLSRSLADAQKFGAAEDPLGFTRQLMGAADPRELGLGAAGDAAEQDIVGLGARLKTLLAEDSDRVQMVAFERWATDFYDVFGALQAALVAVGSPR